MKKDPFPCLVMAIFTYLVYTLPTGYVVGMAIADKKFDEGFWIIASWGAAATFFAIWMFSDYVKIVKYNLTLK